MEKSKLEEITWKIKDILLGIGSLHDEFKEVSDAFDQLSKNHLGSINQVEKYNYNDRFAYALRLIKEQNIYINLDSHWPDIYEMAFDENIPDDGDDEDVFDNASVFGIDNIENKKNALLLIKYYNDNFPLEYDYIKGIVNFNKLRGYEVIELTSEQFVKFELMNFGK